MIDYDFNLDYVLVHLNYNCNLNCGHCRVPTIDKKKKNMPFKTAIKVIDQLVELEVSTVTFTGGEPTIYPDVIELIEYALKKGLNVRLQTNFAAVDKSFLKDFIKIGGQRISLSIDGLEQNHDSIRGKDGLFGNTISLLKEFSHVIEFQVDYVVSKQNFSDFYSVIELLKQIGVKIFSFRTKIPVASTNFQDDYNYSKIELYDLYKDIFTRTRKVSGIRIVSPDPLFNLISLKKEQSYLKEDEETIFLSGCSIGLGMLSIQPNLDILLCSFINKPVGNLKFDELRTIIARINNSDIFINQINRVGLGQCSKCDFRFLCGGCRARSLELNDNYYSTDPLCFLEYL